MRFLRMFFNRKIKMLGRAGIIFTDGKEKYFVDSEGLIAPPYDVVLFPDGIRYYDLQKKNELISPSEQKEIAIKVKQELEAMGMKTIISGDLF